MSAPFNTGDFWITGAAVAGGPDPAYGYPDSVANMSPAPLVLLRFNDADVSDNSDAIDYMGYGDFWYDRDHTQVDGLTVCDCQPAVSTAPLTSAKGIGDGRTVIPLDHTTQFAMVCYVSVTDLTTEDRNVLFHYGQISNTATYGMQVQMRSDGHLWLEFGGASLQSIEVTEHDFSELDEVVIGVDVDDFDIDVYLNGSLLKSFTLTSDWAAPSSYQRCGWGNSFNYNSLYNSTLHRSSAIFSSGIIWNQPIGATAHAFVAGELLQACSADFNCQWHIDFDADAEILATPGDVQLGDFWIIED